MQSHRVGHNYRDSAAAAAAAVVKNQPDNAGDARDAVQSLGGDHPLE